jgi:sugar/nucleoside kinase (ribokinase family)
MISIDVVSHLVLDEIITERFRTQSLGGPSSYAGLTAKQLGADVRLCTKFGLDFPENYVLWLARNGLHIKEGSLSNKKPTTRFQLDYTAGRGRRLRLLARCEDIGLQQPSDSSEERGVLVSPVVNEFPLYLIGKIQKTSFVMLDPQGYLRRVADDGAVFVDKRVDLENVGRLDAVKADQAELKLLTGKDDRLEGIEYLRKAKRVPCVISTQETEPVILAFAKGVFRVPIPKTEKILDKTGTGDIFCGVFLTKYLEHKDEIRACTEAVAACHVAVQKAGLSKVPNPEEYLGLAAKISLQVSRIA